MTNDNPQKKTLLQERWFWVALVLIGYQTGLTLFHCIIFVMNADEYGSQNFLLFSALILASILAYSLVLQRKDFTASRRWMWTSLTAVGSILLGALLLGREGLSALLYSYAGIVISYSIVIGSVLKHRLFLFSDYLGIGLASLTLLLWIFLIAMAPRLHTKLLKILGCILLISILISIGGCAALTQIEIE